MLSRTQATSMSLKELAQYIHNESNQTVQEDHQMLASVLAGKVNHLSTVLEQSLNRIIIEAEQASQKIT